VHYSVVIVNKFILTYFVEMIDMDQLNVFKVKDMREDNNKENYMECLYSFVNAFYREVDVVHLMQNKVISEILTPTDEAFLLLCIMVYFRDHTNCKDDIGDRDVSSILV